MAMTIPSLLFSN